MGGEGLDTRMRVCEERRSIAKKEGRCIIRWRYNQMVRAASFDRKIKSKHTEEIILMNCVFEA